MAEQKGPMSPFQGSCTTRREFLTRSAALGALSYTGSLLAPAAAKAAPKRGGHMRAGISDGASSDTLDPRIPPANFIPMLQWSLRNNLIEAGPGGDLVPELAESWEASSGGAEWHFKLRQGVEFHNGKSFEAEDMIASLNHHGGETKSGAKTIVDEIAEMKADGKHAVTIKLKSGDADFPYYMTSQQLLMLPTKDGEVDWESGVGTGAFLLENFEPGVRALLKRNPNYWKENAGYFDSGELIAMHDSAARNNALITGEVDVIDRVDPAIADRLGSEAGITVARTSGYRHNTYPMLTNQAPFDNNDARLALKYAIDREEVVEKVFSGYATLGNDHPISPANRFHAADLPQRAYDPDKAKYHLKKAGMEGLSLDVHTSDGAWNGAVDASVLYREHAAKAGITLNIVREPSDGYWSNVWMQKSFSAATWAGRLTEGWMFKTAYAGDAKWNDSFWKNDRFDKLLGETRTVLDDDKRREMFRELQMMVRDEGGVLVHTFVDDVFAHTDKLGHPEKMAANRPVDGARFMDRWWFK